MAEPSKRRRGFSRPEIVNAEPELLAYLERLHAFDPDEWERALELKSPVEPYAFDDAPAAPREFGPHGVFVADDGEKGEVAAARHPARRASFGFAGQPVEVRFRGERSGLLYLPLDPRTGKDVDLTSVALFHWNEPQRRFDRVFPSRTRVVANPEEPDAPHAYVWGRATTPGTYVPVGLARDPAVRRTLLAFLGARDILSELDRDARRALKDRICGLILCARDLGGFGGSGTLCEHCLGLDISFDLPELDLITDRPKGGRFDIPKFPPPCRYAKWESAGPTIWHEPLTDLAGCSYELAIEVSGGMSTQLYTASADGGIWRRALPISTSSGWVPMTDSQPSLITTAVSVAPSDGRIVYYVDGLGYLYRSSDRGATWTRSSNMTFARVRRILVDPADPSHIHVAAAWPGFYTSNDGGATWVQRLGGEILDAALDPGDASTVYAAERLVGVQKSFDAGITWQLVLPWIPANVDAGASTMIKIALGRLGSATTRTVVVKFGQAILVNSRGARPPGTPGATPWLSRGQPVNPPAGDGYGDWSHCLAVDPFDNNVMLAGAQTLWRTADGGATWTKVADYDTQHEDQQAVIFDPTRRNVAYLASDGGVFQSLDGGRTWSHINNGLETAQLALCGIADRTAVGNVFHSGFIGTRDATTRIWERVQGHSWEFRRLAGDAKTSWFFYVVGGEDLWRQEFPVRPGVTGFVKIAQFRSLCVAGDPRTASNVLLVGSNGTIQRSLDGFVQPPIVFAPETLVNVDAMDEFVVIAFAPSRPGMAYALAWNGKVWRKGDVRSATAWEYRGQWQAVASSLAIDPKNENRIYALNSATVARSVDGGATWNTMAGSGTVALPQTGGYRSIVAYPHASQILFAASRFGVFMTFNDGAQWRTFDDGLPNAEITELEWSGTALYAVTNGRGLWRREWCP